MGDANEPRSPPSAELPPSGTEPIAEAVASPDADAQTFIEQTLSESGNESAQTSAAKSGAVTIGSMLGPYQIVRKLGQGGMGAVYEARHTKLKKTVAVKVLPQEMMKSPALIARFEREMEAVGQLDHPHIVRAMDADEQDGTHYLVMEFVEGIDLSQLVKTRGLMSVGEACEAIRQAALGLQHAHEHGLVHRDVKPSNLLACTSAVRSSAFRRFDETAPAEGRTTNIKILDLGLARLTGDDDADAGLTSSRQMLGTPDYMAPEQWDDTHSADARADLYSLGCTLCYLLTGQAPFASDKPRSMLHIMKAHADAPIPDLIVRRPEVPAELNTLFQRLLAKSPEDRFQTATEVVVALEPFCSPVAPQQGYADSQPTSRIMVRTTLRGISRRVWWVVGSLLAITVLIGIVSGVGRGTRPTNDVGDTSASRTASAPGQSEETSERRGLTPSGSPAKAMDAPLHAIDYAAERKAAEWVLSVDGVAKLRNTEGSLLAHVNGKLPMEPFTVSEVRLEKDAQFTGDGLFHLRLCRQLDNFVIQEQRQLTDESITQLEGASIAILNLDHCESLTNQSLKSIAAIRNLTSLTLTGSNFTDAGLSALEPLTQLQVFSGFGLPAGITDQGLARLGNAWPQLIHLNIARSTDGKRTAKAFENFRNLQAGVVEGEQLTEEAIVVINAHPTLWTLYLQDSIDDAVIYRLKRLQKITALGIASWHNEDACKLDNVTYVKATWPECIEELYFQGINASPRDDHLVYLANLPKLKTLVLSSPFGPGRYTTVGIAKFRELRPDVKLLVDGKEYPAK